MSSNDYILSSNAGDVLIRIPFTISVNDLRYMIDNIDKLKTLVRNAMVEGLRRCGGGCGVWCHPWQEHDSGSGFGYNCTSSKHATPDFAYIYTYSTRSYCIIADHSENSHDLDINKCKIMLPAEVERDPKYVGQMWLDDWDYFERWLHGAIGSHRITFSGDINKLTSSEELELHRLLDKMNK